ncbi:MAG: amino acid transporter substrate binding protein precursor [Anaerolineales bacterium]|nr:amino acid transporter substrate binding protein precursor [Anaerolineales bacterium]
MIQAVADGQFDAAADGITITADREEIVDFSMGYINVDQRLLVRKDETRIDSIEDIVADESLKLGTQTGTTNYEVATDYLPAERVSAFEQFPFAVQALGSDLVGPVNQALEALIANGFLNEVNTRFFGPSFSVTYDDLG